MEKDRDLFKEIIKMLLPSRFSRVRLCVTPQMAAHQALPSLGFPRQEYWSGLPFPSPIKMLGRHNSEQLQKHSVYWAMSMVSSWKYVYLNAALMHIRYLALGKFLNFSES